MGLFDTPVIVNENLLKLKNKVLSDFKIDVKIETDDNIFHVTHDYFDSPCYFKVTSWMVTSDKKIYFKAEWYPENDNITQVVKKNILISNLDFVLDDWQSSIVKMLNFETLYTDLSLENLKRELVLKLGLTEENADKLLDETQKLHANQYCDQICDILDDLEGKEYDVDKIREIKFDLEKIKRDIESLKIKTAGELANGIVKAWSKIKLAKISEYVVGKIGDGMAGKLIDGIISSITE